MVLCWFWFFRLIFFSGLFSLSIFRGSANDFNGERKNDDHVDCSTDDNCYIRKFINPRLKRRGLSLLPIYGKVINEKIGVPAKSISCEGTGLRAIASLLEKCDIHTVKVEDRDMLEEAVISKICNLDNNPKALKWVIHKFDCKNALKCGKSCPFLGIYTYNAQKKSDRFKLEKVICEESYNNCKVIEKLNKILWKEKLRKRILVFLEVLGFFVFVYFLFWLLNSDNEDCRNKKGTKRLGIVNGGGSRSRGRSRSKNKNRNIKNKLGKIRKGRTKKKARK